MSKVIELKKIGMSFSKKGKLFKAESKIDVLKDINLDIEEGEIVAVVGESGCGKTTIGKIITGLLKPTQGEILFNGKNLYKFDLRKFTQTREQVQFVQQDSYAALNPVRTIYQSLAAPILHHNKKISSRDLINRINELMEMVGLTPPEQFLVKFPHMLSGGQRQRILMARAISLNPKLIVADEPVSMIDVSMRLSILNLMSELNRKMNISFIYITHDLATARYFASNGRICVMYLGEIVEVGTVDKLLSNPRHPYTQALLTAVPVPDPVVAKKAKEIPVKSMDITNLENRPDGCSFYDRCPYASEQCHQNIPYVDVDGVKVKCCKLDEVPKWKG